MNLLEWTKIFVEQKDLLHRKLLSSQVKERTISFVFKDRTHEYFIEEILDEQILKKIEPHEYKTIVCLYKKENLNFLIKHWKAIAAILNLSFIFVDIAQDRKWIINPHTHNSIADNASLELGLKTMFENA
ncbi:hypothetical protein C4573_04760 [Candidatus Woesearchaeota archaeon]|nr:MAG: hypothetical protein C4573_04760 [Candidatus Woesearchaeota archaeon]